MPDVAARRPVAADERSYAAERHLERWFDADQPVNAYGSSWYLETEVKFGRVEDVQRYVDRVLAHVGCSRPVTVRKGRKHASMGQGVMVIPDSHFGRRETTVLHELAHHLTPLDHEHGPAFRSQFVDLLALTGHPVAARLLEIYFHEEG